MNRARKLYTWENDVRVQGDDGSFGNWGITFDLEFAKIKDRHYISTLNDLDNYLAGSYSYFEGIIKIFEGLYEWKGIEIRDEDDDLIDIITYLEVE